MLNGQLQTEDDKAQSNVKRQAFNVLKKTETTSGIRHGLGGLAGKVPSNNNINREAIGVKVFEVSFLCNIFKNLIIIIIHLCNVGQR